MKTTKFLPHLFLAGIVSFGTACSSTSSTGTGASTGGSTMTDTSAGTSDAGTSGTGTSGTSGATGTSSSGSMSSSGTMSGTGTMSSGSVSGSGATGTDAAADQTAFIATFATMDDPTFMLTAASSNMLELQLSQTALQQATKPDVKKYAQMMVDHHTMATQQWKTVAQPLGISMPTTLMPVHQALSDKVTGKSGKQFDEAYMDAMETAHKMDVALFDIKAKQAQTPSVKSFASKSLPMLRSHHTMADQIEKKAD